MIKPLFQRVLVAYNGSKSSLHAFMYGVMMAKSFKCKLKVVYVVDTDTIKKLTLIDSEAAVRELGSPKVLNVLLLGAAVRTGELGLELEDIEAALHEKVPARFQELNDRALRYTEGKKQS